MRKHNAIPDEWRILLVNPRWKTETPNFIPHVEPPEGRWGRFDWLEAYIPATSIRFIAENYRDVEILEYPSMAEYERQLAKGYDVVGLSFYTYQMEEVKQMVHLARRYGVKEVWGGGWGIDTPGARNYFDRSFGGYGEQLLMPILGNRWKGGLRHPILVGRTRFFKIPTKVGYLYSIRGCKWKCAYCPTPALFPERLIMPLSEVERVLDSYAKEKVSAVVIYDETFLSDYPYSWQIVDMLDERGLPWFCLTSAVELHGNISKLRHKGFLGCLMGIESLRDKTLIDYKRGPLTNLNLKILKEMKDNSCYVVGSYILCNESDTKQSMRADIEKLASLEIPAVMPTILTPYPPTPLFDQFRDRIIDWNWEHWDDGHLVWRHPEVTPQEAREILLECAHTCNSLAYSITFMLKEALRRIIPFKIKRMLLSKH